MLAKAHKLDLRKQPAFFRTAIRVPTQFFTLFSKKNDLKLLFQVVISRGVAKTAVERNTLKRTVYDICAEFLPHYSSTKLSLVILIRSTDTEKWIKLLKSTIQQELELT